MTCLQARYNTLSRIPLNRLRVRAFGFGLRWPATLMMSHSELLFFILEAEGYQQCPNPGVAFYRPRMPSVSTPGTLIRQGLRFNHRRAQ